MELTVSLPRPHAKQAAFMRSPAKRKVIVAGRRGGKTTGAATLAVEAMLNGRRVLEAAPTADQTDAFWETCARSMAALIATKTVYKNESRRILEMAHGGRIKTKTAWDADSLRGDYADLLILDEYSLMAPDAWNEVGVPMLLDNNGDAVFIFTPKRKNHAHAHYVRAMGDTTGRWSAWHFTSHDNPHLSQEALDEITADMTEDAYRQEIMAQFLDNEGAVFRNIAACVNAPLDATPADHGAHTIVAGTDWGKHQDYHATSIGCATCRVELELYREKLVDYVYQRERTEQLFSRWGVSYALAETNAMGEPNLELLQAAALPVHGFATTAQSKPPLIENLKLALEAIEWQFLDVPVATGELEAYEQRVSPHTGRSTYSAPAGVNDDTVMARAMMIRAAGEAAGQKPVSVKGFNYAQRNIAGASRR
jgi:hypothetical protein